MGAENTDDGKEDDEYTIQNWNGAAVFAIFAGLIFFPLFWQIHVHYRSTLERSLSLQSHATFKEAQDLIHTHAASLKFIATFGILKQYNMGCFFDPGAIPGIAGFKQCYSGDFFV